MTMHLLGRSHRDIVLPYGTQSLARKPSYRVVVDIAGKVDLHGWAIADNTSREDCPAVPVGVGSSSALSFCDDLHGIRVALCETLHTEEEVLAEMCDTEIPRTEVHLDRRADGFGAMDVQSAAGGPDRQPLRFKMAKIAVVKDDVEIQGHARKHLDHHEPTGGLAGNSRLSRRLPSRCPCRCVVPRGKSRPAEPRGGGPRR